MKDLFGGQLRHEKPEILIIEDEPDIAELIEFNLQQEGFSTRTALDGESAIEELSERQPGLVILDLMLPGMSGLDLCRRLRSDPETAGLPIVMVTAKAAESDRIVGLEIGADDYVTKPFSPRELVARVRAVLRRSYREMPPQSANRYAKGRIAIDFDTYEVVLDGEKAELSLREFELLSFFVKSPNRAYNRLQILDLVWGEDTFVESRTVDVHVRRLRKQIERDDTNPELILTIRGVGYKFNDSALEP